MADKLHVPGAPQVIVPFSRPSSPGPRSPQVGWIGLGAMGYPMARNFVNKRPAHPAGNAPLLVWNRIVSKSQQLQKELGEANVHIAQNVGHIAVESDIIVTSLGSDEAVKLIYEQFVQALKDAPSKTRLFVETSTIYPTLAGELDKIISSIPHSHLITSPVFGAKPVAERGDLIIAMSGDYHSKREAAHLFVPAIGRKVIDLGENIEKAPTFKLLGNSLLLGAIEIISEAHTLGEKTGISSELVHEIMQDLLNPQALERFSDKIVRDEFDGTQGFSIDGGIKDASHIRRLSTQYNAPMPAIDVAHQHLITARALHQNNVQNGTAPFQVLDWLGLAAGTRLGAGIDPLDSKKHSKVVPEEED
ncbi:hypothetical protein AX16_000358 [Volvariella volvacea WC 439]|nr:hypothetical protein AX16_000358 [Volvariella volvacea WC 439]